MTAAVPRAAATSRCALRVRGTVQGVGFRPTVYRVARAANLGGFVLNDAAGVWIEVEGDRDAVTAFPAALRRAAPPLARIDAIEVEPLRPRGETEFRVAASSEAAGATFAEIPVDTGICDTCRRELFDPEDRRYRHPFITCTDCGPRYTIVKGLPYDRRRTTMAGFALCAACRHEYEDPADRRFHTEPLACPDCGPRLALVIDIEGERRRHEGDEVALARAAEIVSGGGILALKGLGGYQLVVDAANDEAVRCLRERKNRPHKPFAVMAPDLAAARALAEVSPEAAAALTSPARPIVLLPRLRSAAIAESVAPALAEIGVMLPTTPLHHLLLAATRPCLVMTSGNVTDEPIAKDDDEAARTLGRIADALLVHDRPIHSRADDSVVRIVAGGAQPVRRGRGLAPDPVPLGAEAPPILAVGAEVKNAICLTRGDAAFLSQHIGDLGGLEARAFFEEVAAHLAALLDVTPTLVAHDLHPDYAATRWALGRGLPAIAVQHHHAHVAACLAEHGRTGPAIGVAFDGTGCGPAGEAWGGEILAFDFVGFRRAGHLRPLALPGGEAAIREPWRLGVAALLDAGERPEHPSSARLQPLLDEGGGRGRGRAPRATGAGRWFDAAAAILGVRDRISYEAQAAIELEALASAGESDAPPYPFLIEPTDTFVVDLRPVVRALVADRRAGEPAARIASRFYTTMAEVVAASCLTVRRRTGLTVVALSGGCFQSQLLSERAKARLEANGFDVLLHRRVPPNDGGIAYGQAVVAAHRVTARKDA
jgi:hydrogenase maturation protein HypF